MDYEKKYNNVVNKFAYLLESTDLIKGELRQDIESIFPELKDSEGERIRKELLAWLKSRDGQTLPINRYNAAVAWLEKQGEYDKIVEKAKSEKQRVLLTETNGNAGIDWDTRSLADTKMLLEYGLDFINKKLEKQGEQKPAEWSEIDKANLEDSIYFVKEFRRSNLCDNESRLQNSRTCIEWLASLKDRVLPQPKQEWSEEDERLFQIIIDILDKEEHKGHLSHTDLIACVKKLKSLRPQKQWKPSEEQIKAVKEAACYSSVFSEKTIDNLISLSKDLKKVKD